MIASLIIATLFVASAFAGGYGGYAAPQQQYAPQPQYMPQAPQPVGYAQGGQQVLTGYLLTPIPAPAEYANNPAEIPPSAQGQFAKIGGAEDHPLYVIQNPDTTGSSSFLPPGYSSQPAQDGQKPNGFFMPVNNAPIQDGRAFTLMVVNGMRTHGPAYNALPVPEVETQSEVVGYNEPAPAPAPAPAPSYEQEAPGYKNARSTINRLAY